jgi:hypothetical protein
MAEEGVEDDTSLRDRRVSFDAELAKVAAEIDDESRTEAPAPASGTGAPRMEPEPTLGSVAGEGDEIVLAAREHDPERVDLIESGVVAERGSSDGLEEHLAPDQAAQIVSNAVAGFLQSTGFRWVRGRVCAGIFLRTSIVAAGSRPRHTSKGGLADISFKIIIFKRIHYYHLELRETPAPLLWAASIARRIVSGIVSSRVWR